MTPLHWAAMVNSVDVAELLIRSGAAVHAKDKVGTFLLPIYDTSLHYDHYPKLLIRATEQ